MSCAAGLPGVGHPTHVVACFRRDAESIRVLTWNPDILFAPGRGVVFSDDQQFLHEPPMIPSQFPVPVVRLVILDEELRVLLLRRSAGAFSGGLWCLPGGKVDFGNTLAETVEQELREETGLKVTNCRFLFPQDSLPAAMGEMHCINLYFEVFASGHLRINEESSDACWFGHEELAGLEIAFRNGEALERYFDEFAR